MYNVEFVINHTLSNDGHILKGFDALRLLAFKIPTQVCGYRNYFGFWGLTSSLNMRA